MRNDYIGTVAKKDPLIIDMLLGKYSDEAHHWQQSDTLTQCIISNETRSKMAHRTEESPRNRGTEKEPHVLR